VRRAGQLRGLIRVGEIRGEEDHAGGPDAPERLRDVGRELRTGHAHDHELAEPGFDAV